MQRRESQGTKIQARLENSLSDATGLRPGGDLKSVPFTTIDDCLQLTEQLRARLKLLGQYRHPLAVRKGVSSRKGVKDMSMELSGKGDRDSVWLRAGSRTYFVDIDQTTDGKPYLRISESRFKGEGNERERNSIVIFPEKVREFAKVVGEQAAKLE